MIFDICLSTVSTNNSSKNMSIVDTTDIVVHTVIRETMFNAIGTILKPFQYSIFLYGSIAYNMRNDLWQVGSP